MCILLVPLVGHGRPGLPRDRPPKGFQQTSGPSQGTYKTATGKDIGAGPHRGLNITGTCAGTSTPGGATKPSFVRAVHPEDIHTATGRSVGAGPILGTSLVAGDYAGTCPTRGTSTTPPGEAPGLTSLRVTGICAGTGPTQGTSTTTGKCAGVRPAWGTTQAPSSELAKTVNRHGGEDAPAADSWSALRAPYTPSSARGAKTHKISQGSTGRSRICPSLLAPAPSTERR
jgi:hypothetical protein